jgi:hypothetical protein
MGGIIIFLDDKVILLGDFFETHRDIGHIELKHIGS